MQPYRLTNHALSVAPYNDSAATHIRGAGGPQLERVSNVCRMSQWVELLINTPALNVWNLAYLNHELRNVLTPVPSATYDTFNHRNFSIGLPATTAPHAADDTNPQRWLDLRESVRRSLNIQIQRRAARALELGLKLVFLSGANHSVPSTGSKALRAFPGLFYRDF